MVDTAEHGSLIASTGDTERDRARTRVERKRKLRADFVAYVVINTALIVAWAATGFGYFWPGWVLGFWAVFMLLDAWNLHDRPVTDDEIDEEMRHRGRR